jgi:hypothetical protein
MQPIGWCLSGEEGQCFVVLAGGYAGHVKDVHIDSWKDCITAEGFDHVLCASWRDDNAGEWMLEG